MSVPISPGAPIAQTLTPTPTPVPTRNDAANFAVRADAHVVWQATSAGEFSTFTTQANALQARLNLNAQEARTNAVDAETASVAASASASAAAGSAATAINAAGTQGTSTTSVALALGVFNITIQTGKAFTAGQFVDVVATASIGNFATGRVISYTTGTGAISIQLTAVTGSGTFAAWAVNPATPNSLVSQSGALSTVPPTLVWDFWRMRFGGAAGLPINATGGSCSMLGPNGKLQAINGNSAEVEWGFDDKNKGLVIESTRESVCLWSQDLSNAVWTRTDITAPTASTRNFAGIALYTVAKSNTTANANLSQALPATVNPINHVATLALMAGTVTQCDIALLGANAPVAGLDAASTAQPVLSGPGTITRIGGANWRITGLTTVDPTFVEFRRTYTSAAEATSIAIYPDTAASTTSGASVLVGRVAVERGVGILRATSYVQTSGSTITRAADFYTVTGTDFTDFWNPDKGTLIVCFDTANLGAATALGLRIDDGTDSGRMLLYVSSSGAAWVENYDGGVQQAYLQISTALTGRVCIALSYRRGSFWASANGQAAVSAGTGTVGTKTRMILGSYANNSFVIDGAIQVIAYKPTFLTPTQLANESSYWRIT